MKITVLWLAAFFTAAWLQTFDVFAAAAPTLQRAAKALPDMPDEDLLGWGIAATAATAAMWDQEGNLAVSSRLVRLVREVGALAELPLNLYALGVATTWIGSAVGSRRNSDAPPSVEMAIAPMLIQYGGVRSAGARGRNRTR